MKQIEIEKIVREHLRLNTRAVRKVAYLKPYLKFFAHGVDLNRLYFNQESLYE